MLAYFHTMVQVTNWEKWSILVFDSINKIE